MKKAIIFLCLLLLSHQADAKSVILMIGDGMGYNHLSCTNQDYNLFLPNYASASVKTSSANNKTTDSAASATAYSCGIKTKNYRLGLDRKNKPCKTIAEKALEQGKDVYILTTDNDRGATPSAFYVHTKSRYDNDNIDDARNNFQKQAYLEFDIKELSIKIDELLPLLSQNDREYFVMIEGAKIDKASHHNDLETMKEELADFDRAVKKIWEFASDKPINIYVTADHETGGLFPDKCTYSTHNHTPLDVPLWIYGDDWNSDNTYDNTQVYEMMNRALFDNQD